MKSKLLRVLAIILAFSMLICCFSACKGDDEEDETKPTVIAPENDNFDDWATDDMPIIDDSLSNEPINNGSTDAWNNDGSNNSGSNNDYWSNNGSTDYPSNNNGGTSNNGNSNSSSGSGLTWDDIHNGGHEFEESIYENFDTPEERNEILRLAGYEYDEAQDIYYTHLNPWQRYFGFTDLYDDAAPITNMWYLTLKIDFKYKDLLWRLQWWKGQYGILEGAELGVYTKDPSNEASVFYECAADENLLTMTFDFYHSISDYNKGNILFTRAEQEHWWLTGFKFGVVDPKKCVVRATLYAYDDEMADGIEAGLKAVTDDKGNWNGFTQYREGTTKKNFYIRKGNKFSVVWVDAGYVNWSWMMDRNDPDIPEQN